MANGKDGLEIDIQATKTQAEKSLNELIKQLQDTGKQITSVQTIAKQGVFQKNIVTATKGAKKLNIQIDAVGNTLKETVTTANTSKKAFNQLFDTGKLYLVWNLTKRIRDVVKGWVTNAIDFQETTNLFNVSMGTSYMQATRFQNKLAEAFGTARNEMMNYQATFKNILSGLGNLSTATTEKISESLTKMTLDYSSLFNVEQKASAEKFKSALTRIYSSN